MQALEYTAISHQLNSVAEVKLFFFFKLFVFCLLSLAFKR